MKLAITIVAVLYGLLLIFHYGSGDPYDVWRE